LAIQDNSAPKSKKGSNNVCPLVLSFFSYRLIIQSPCPSAAVAEAEETPANTKGDPEVPEPADIQME
jgi:hypothetical protein